MSAPGPFMARALELAEAWRGRTSPNPSVGSVVVRDGRIVGEGWHEGPRTSHAEVMALEAAGKASRGAKLYSTLEPCSHHGRTPPCAEACIRAGVTEVRFAHLDPDPQVSGRGRARLEAAGVVVSTGEGEADARRLNEAYLKQRTTGRPFVIAKFAASLDGKTAATSGDSRWVSAPETLAWSHELRTRIDAIAVGIETVLVDNPKLTARPGEELSKWQPLRLVVDSRGRTPPNANVLSCGTPAMVATTGASPVEWRKSIEATGVRIEVLPEASGRVALPALLDALGASGVLSLLVEGGGVLLGSLFDALLVDKVHAVVAPMIIGGANAPMAVGGVGATRMTDALRLRDVAVERLGADVLVTGYAQQAG